MSSTALRAARIRATAAAAALLALLASCESPSDSGAGPPAGIGVVDGGGQTGAAGQALAEPVVVQVVDARGRPVPGQAVSFVVTAGGGSVFAATVTTDDDGRAANQWTLGPAAGAAQTLEARVSTASGQLTAVVGATAGPGAPALLRAYLPGDTIFAGTPGAPLDSLQAVRAVDANGNPVAGVAITWAADNGGTFNPATSTTDAQGIARSRWTMGPTATVFAHAAQASAAGATPVRFYARVVTGFTKNTGDGRTVTAGTAIPVSVNVTGPYGPVPGARVRWTVTSGGGTVAPPASEPNGNGVAQAVWTVGSQAGPQTLTAQLGGATLTFTATVLPQGGRTLVAQVPGTVLDADAGRVLWLDPSGTGRVRIRDRASGVDVTILDDPARSPAAGGLFAGGALVLDRNSAGPELLEWRNGTLASLGPVREEAQQSYGARRPFPVAGAYTAWTSPAGVHRRDLSSGTTLTVDPDPGQVAGVPDVAANGDVVWARDGAIWRYRAGVATQVSNPLPDIAYGERAPRTDGVNVLYVSQTSIAFNNYLNLVRPGGDEVLTGSHASRGVPLFPESAYTLNNGWVAWVEVENEFATSVPVMRRSPAGVDEQLTASGTVGRLDALGPDGTLVYQVLSSKTALSGNRFIQAPGGSPRDLGSGAAGEKVVYRGGAFLLLSGGSVFQLTP
ncbi:MAG TPA: Ig-like domain-containing protein [Longimicrobium sp.]|nr:Ig-like domain-containing protein [Longimicrobium sp.]